MKTEYYYSLKCIKHHSISYFYVGVRSFATCTLLHLNCFSCRRTVLWDIIFFLLFSDHPPVCPPCDNEMNTDVVLEHMCASEFGNVSLLSVYFVNEKNDQSNVFKLFVYMINSKNYEKFLF